MNAINNVLILSIAIALISGCVLNDEGKSKDEFCSDGTITFQSKIEFDNKSRIIEMGFWSSFDRIWITSKTQYNEDGTDSIKEYSDGQLTSTRCQYSKTDSSTYTVSIYTCPPILKLLAVGKFDSLWRQTEYTGYNESASSIDTSKTEYEYDDERSTVKTYEYIDGIRSLYSTTYLDENKKTKKIERYDDSSSTIRNVELYEYYSTYIESKRFEGEKNTEITRGYLDDKGNLTKTVSCTL